MGQPLVPIGVYDHEPSPEDGPITALPLPEGVQLLGLDSTRVLRQMRQLTRLRDALSNLYDGLIPD